MGKGKTARKKGAERAKFRRRQARHNGEYKHITRRKQRVRLKRKKK